jgi:hypothetical protein
MATSDDPGHDEVLAALERALEDNPRLRDMPSEEIARQLVLGGYVGGEPSPEVMAEALDSLRAEEEAFGPDIPPEEA